MKFRPYLTGLIAVLVVAPFLQSCDSAIESDYKEQLVVSAFFYAGEPVDSVILHRTTPFGNYFSDLDYAVDSARVTLSDGDSVYVLPANGRKGRYGLHSLVVVPGRTYSLTVSAPNHQTGGTHILSASTIVPMPIQISQPASQLRGQSIVLDTNQLSTFQYFISAGPVDEPNRKYVLGVTPLDTTIGKISLSPQGPPVDTLAFTRYSFVTTGPLIGVSPRLFGWYGPNRISFIALDTNWVDYRRQVFSPNTTYQPSLNHVAGGMGVFASGARDTMTVFIRPKE